MQLQPLELELAAVSTSISAGCIPCTRYHIAQCKKLGASESDTIAAVHSGATLRDLALCQIRQEFDADVDEVPQVSVSGSDLRQQVLCGIGSAVASNAVAQLKRFLSQSKHVGVSDDEAMEVIGLAERIKEKAASHLDKEIGKLNADRRIARAAAKLCT